MTSNKIFLDSNVILYLFDSLETKRSISQNLLSQSPLINPQVLVEVGNICKRKLGFSKEQVTDLWKNLMQDCICTDIGGVTMTLAVSLISKYDFQLFDAIIVAGALEANCDILYSEDMQHKMVVEDTMTIINPFLLN
ncbi:PIN domain-containing protein [Dyadobacter sp. CY343]|uniref:PIN domain-containing protein n=1 Tax=Dyadobacter sp. CY343 TaxID=2907299 RepID=UPI001F3D608E|nr:PIN domain-containing protein [Dyadobacter sp. CY343]MCE7059993.1 PIN domain-containing protein [Dyadobacter sp. CY343]